jgi:membrane associated rhomboid family serine protease/predicted amidohydrolase
VLRQPGDDGSLSVAVPRRWPLTTTCLTAAFALAYALDAPTRPRTGLGPEELPARWVFDSEHPRAWHFVSYAFVHGDRSHLLSNLLVIALAGACVERRLGPRATAVAALLLTVAACAGFHALDPRDLYGASGLAAGLVALAGVLWAGATDASRRARLLVSLSAAAHILWSELLPALGGHASGGLHAHVPGAVAGGLLGVAWLWRQRAMFPHPSDRSLLRTRAPRAVIALLVGGVALGLGMTSAPLGWLGLALTAYGLACDAPLEQRAFGLFAAGLITSTLRLYFLWDGFCAYLDALSANRWATGVVITVTLFNRAPIALIALGWRRAPAYVPLWLPPAWLLGERLWDAATHLPLDAWMLTQGRTPAVLHTIAWLGYFPTALLALGWGAAVGAAFARRGRERGVWLAACALAAALGCLVPARRHGTAALRGVVALRLSRYTGALDPIPGAELIVWPETSVRSALAIAREGSVTGVRLPPLMRGEGTAAHLIGTFSRLPGRVQNVAAVVDPDGEVRWMRAKRRLMFVGEAPLFGHMLTGVRPFVPGVVVPVTRVAGRTVGVLVCLELFDRALVAQATPPGVDLLLVPAGDSIVGRTPVGRELMVAVSALVAAERGVAVARAAWRGVSVLIAPDGTVVARSDAGHLHHAVWSP